jgi:hypothetical protein
LVCVAKQSGGHPRSCGSLLNRGLLRALWRERPSVVVVDESSSQARLAACYCALVGALLIYWSRLRLPTGRDTNTAHGWFRWTTAATDDRASPPEAAEQLHRVIVCGATVQGMVS